MSPIFYLKDQQMIYIFLDPVASVKCKRTINGIFGLTNYLKTVLLDESEENFSISEQYTFVNLLCTNGLQLNII